MFVNFTKEPFEFPDFVSLLEVLKWESGDKKTSTDGGSEHEGRGEKLRRYGPVIRENLAISGKIVFLKF